MYLFCTVRFVNCIHTEQLFSLFIVDVLFFDRRRQFLLIL